MWLAISGEDASASNAIYSWSSRTAADHTLLVFTLCILQSEKELKYKRYCRTPSFHLLQSLSILFTKSNLERNTRPSLPAKEPFKQPCVIQKKSLAICLCSMAKIILNLSSWWLNWSLKMLICSKIWAMETLELSVTCYVLLGAYFCDVTQVRTGYPFFFEKAKWTVWGQIYLHLEIGNLFFEWCSTSRKASRRVVQEPKTAMHAMSGETRL